MTSCSRYELIIIMEEQQLNEISKKLVTWLPMDVYFDLLDFAKKNTLTGLGKFDFATAIRLLLQKSRTMDGLELLNERLNELEVAIHELQNKPVQETDSNEVKTFGDIKLKGGNK